MLILSRKPGESIVIDGGITVVVLACDKGGVRLGIEAPDSVSIVRGEIVRQVADENRRAGAVSPESGRALLAALGVPAPGAAPGPPSGAPPASPPGPALAPAPDPTDAGPGGDSPAG
jgi:carbon storage regulator